MLTRRTFFAGLGAMVAAPAIVGAHIMRVRPFVADLSPTILTPSMIAKEALRLLDEEFPFKPRGPGISGVEFYLTAAEQTNARLALSQVVRPAVMAMAQCGLFQGEIGPLIGGVNVALEQRNGLTARCLPYYDGSSDQAAWRLDIVQNERPT